MKKKIGGLVFCVLTLCCLFAHRRVIKALITQEEMPKAPKWHCWVKKENRRAKAFVVFGIGVRQDIRDSGTLS